MSSSNLLRSRLLTACARPFTRAWKAPPARVSLASYRAAAAPRTSRQELAASCRCFSSEALSDILARELGEEVEEGRAEMPEDLVELKSTIEKDWKIVDDGATTRLFRSIGATKVVVSFHCQDSVEGVDQQYVEENNEEPAVPFRFEILVAKTGNTLVLNCISNAGATAVDGAAMTTEDIESIQAHGIGRNKYQGPEFQELAEDLQAAFHAHVFDELGVNDDVTAFVSMYADYKEQLEYVGFLKNVSKVLS